MSAGGLNVFSRQDSDGVDKEDKAQGGADEVDGPESHLSTQALRKESDNGTTQEGSDRNGAPSKESIDAIDPTQQVGRNQALAQ